MLKVVFMGTPQFAVPSFEKLCSIADVVAVVCQPDRARDRKGNFILSPVKKAALERGLPVFQFEKIKRDGVETLKELAPDVVVTCAYGQILSQEILDIPRLGVLNVHASLLPEYRGSSPLQWALINGEKKTGVTIMKTDIGMDTGAVLATDEFDLSDDVYIDGLFEKAATVGAELLEKTLPSYANGKIIPVPQDGSKATHCVMLKKEDARINWNDDCNAVRNKIRGLGYGYTFYNDQMLKIFRLETSDKSGVPGKVSVGNGSVEVYCGSGSVILEELQLQNKKRLGITEFLNGTKMKSGEFFISD